MINIFNVMRKTPRIDLHDKTAEQLEYLTKDMSRRELVRAVSQKNEHGDNVLTHANSSVTQFFADRLSTYELFRLAMEVDDYGDNAVTNAFAQTTKIYAEKLPATHFKELVAHHNSHTENALFRAGVEKTKIITEVLGELEGGEKTILRLASQQSSFHDNVINNEHVSKQEIDIIARAIPLGSNLFGLISPKKGEGVRDHITKAEQLIDLMVGRSDRSDAVQEDFDRNPKKYLKYASDIIKKPSLVKKIEDKNVVRALNMIVDYQNEELDKLR